MPMKNFHAHQIEHMSQVISQDGICFVLLHFSTLKETYLLPAKDLIAFYQIDKGTKSMPLDYIKKRGYAIAEVAYPQVPYLEIIEKLLGGNTLPTMLAVFLNLPRTNCNQQTQVRFTTLMVVLLPTWELRNVRVHQQMKFQQL